MRQTDLAKQSNNWEWHLRTREADNIDWPMLPARKNNAWRQLCPFPDRNIEIQKIEQGWNGKPKGLFQVSGKKGFLNNKEQNEFKNYTLKGRKINGNINVQTSLTHLLSSCTDFWGKRSNVTDNLAQRMGVEINWAPKWHCKMAGEAHLGLLQKTLPQDSLGK